MDAESITTWCCCSQGTSRMNVEFNGQTFTPDDTAVATIKIDNSKCKLRCTKVTLEFWMSMLMESSNGEVFTMEKVLQDETTEGPMPGDGSWEKTMDIELAKIMFEVVTEKVNLSSKSVTLSLEDQYMVQRLQPKVVNSRFFKIKYNLVVKTEFEGKIMCSETPEIMCPLNIVGKMNPDCYGFECARD